LEIVGADGTAIIGELAALRMERNGDVISLLKNGVSIGSADSPERQNKVTGVAYGYPVSIGTGGIFYSSFTFSGSIGNVAIYGGY
jgi:hypothetical protein